MPDMRAKANRHKLCEWRCYIEGEVSQMQELYKCGCYGYKVVFRIILWSGAVGSSLDS